jgi:2-haloacid dehalogenase
MHIDTVVFDLGGVVLDWDPAHLYRQLIDDPAELDRFLGEVCTMEWHLQHDAGRPMAETIPELIERHPEHAGLIGLWRDRYVDMVGGYVDGSVELLRELQGRVRLLALTNMPADVVDDLLAGFPALRSFEAMVVSGVEQVMKPSAEIFGLLSDRHGVDPARTLFVDDKQDNVDAARACGFRGATFISTARLRSELVECGVLPRQWVPPISQRN